MTNSATRIVVALLFPHLRERKGDAINAACGQLRRSEPTLVPLSVGQGLP